MVREPGHEQMLAYADAITNESVRWHRRAVCRLLPWPAVFLLGWSPGALAQSKTPVFKVDTDLQSVAVQVTDHHGNAVHGLTASDFTLLEDGKPQKIAFFETESEPISLAILLDSGRSMDFGGKLERARALLAPLIRGNRPEDEIFFVPFTDEMGPFQQLTAEQRLRPPDISELGHRGSALYDALASTLCHMRVARNIRQAIVVITDGVDQHSRLMLEQLIALVQSSSPQAFMVGLFDKPEYELFRRSQKTVTILGLREIDNPVLVFDRLAKESGAESFFPSSEHDFKKALDRISELLQAEYTLAYYPQRIDEVRKIEVKVKRSGVRISARHSVGAESGLEAVHFTAAACKVSPEEHPYPWESRVTSNSSSPVVYHEDFSDPRGGWPKHHDPVAGSQYIPGGYEVSRRLQPRAATAGRVEDFIIHLTDPVIAAYGPWWSNFRASVWLEAQPDPPSHVGIAFGVNESGYYAFVLTPPVDGMKMMAFEFFKGTWDGKRELIIPRTSIAELRRTGTHKLTVECSRGQISLAVDDHPAGRVQNAIVEYGLVGFSVGDCGFNGCSVIVHDLLVEAKP